MLIRPLWALTGGLALTLLWLGLVTYQQNADPAGVLTAVGESAQRVGLAGLAAQANLQAAQWQRRQLDHTDRESGAGQALVSRIVDNRMRAARLLLQAGYMEAAEQIALESARADFSDLEARALLLETRLQGSQAERARRELMLLLTRREHPQVLYLLGRSFADEKRLDDAEAFYHRAQSMAPDHFPTLLGLAELQVARRDRVGAMRYATQAERAARTPAQRAALRQVRLEADARAISVVHDLQSWWGEHWGTLAFGAAYLLFLLSPGWVSLLRRRAWPSLRPH